MRRLLFIASLLLAFVATDAAAQIDVKPGVTAGVNLANIRGDDVSDDVSRRTAFHVGGVLLLDLAGPIDVQPEAVFSQKGFVVDQQGTDVTAKVNYLQINGLARFKPTAGPISPAFFAGPYLAFEVSEEVEASGDGGSISADTENFSSTDFGLVIGGGIEAATGFGQLQFDVRYDLGLTDASDDDRVEFNNGAIGISAALLF